jgi:predicted metal-dependent hydrolase
MNLPEKIVILGDIYSINYSEKKFLKPRVIQSGFNITIFSTSLEAREFKVILDKWITSFAKKIIERRVVELSTIYGFHFNRISVRNQSTRWGSCSSNKNLNFNWRLILGPKMILDYVIIHELAHTLQMNHSKAFWAIVQNIIPEYKSLRLWLKKNGQLLKY